MIHLWVEALTCQKNPQIWISLCALQQHFHLLWAPHCSCSVPKLNFPADLFEEVQICSKWSFSWTDFSSLYMHLNTIQSRWKLRVSVLLQSTGCFFYLNLCLNRNIVMFKLVSVFHNTDISHVLICTSSTITAVWPKPLSTGQSLCSLLSQLLSRSLNTTWKQRNFTKTHQKPRGARALINSSNQRVHFYFLFL